MLAYERISQKEHHEADGYTYQELQAVTANSLGDLVRHQKEFERETRKWRENLFNLLTELGFFIVMIWCAAMRSVALIEGNDSLANIWFLVGLGANIGFLVYLAMWLISRRRKSKTDKRKP